MTSRSVNKNLHRLKTRERRSGDGKVAMHVLAINEIPPVVDPGEIASVVRVVRAARAARIYDQVE
jgi:hypothetical protein